jgi:hypothetical protein
MIPCKAIADCERPLINPCAAGVPVYSASGQVCYENFTLKALSIGSSSPIFPGVMTEVFTNISRGAGAAVWALRGNHRPLQLSAQNVLSSFSNRQLQTANRLPS